MREIALKILLMVNSGRDRARNVLDNFIKEMDIKEPDKSFLSELVYGTIRWYGKLDWIISQFVPSKKLKKFQPEIVEILRLGLYQLFFLRNVPDYAAVNESVILAKKYGNVGASGLVNAVLRRVIRDKDKIKHLKLEEDPVKYIAVNYSHPEWMIEQWIKRYGVEETIKLCMANNLRPPIYARVNLLKTDRKKLLNYLNNEGIKARESPNLSESIEIIDLVVPIYELSSYKLGLFQIQDEGAMLISHILDPKPGEIIIDACAAPGGKTTHIAELMQNKGKIFAFDIDIKRLNLLKENCTRLGITIVEAIESDSSNLSKYELADRIIVDVPCTGLGVLRRRIESRWRRTIDNVNSLPEFQYKILEGSAKCLKPGGVLVYCTCTIEPEENEQIIYRFIKAHPNFKIQSVKPYLPKQLQDKNIVTPEGFMQTLPHLHNMDGFFAVRMVSI
ncbi:MAG: 16S rRNA (cytosine(967)-C(5))-methyltransferase RsmB [bacterium]